MDKLMATGTLGLAGLVTTGLIAWQAPLALAAATARRPAPAPGAASPTTAGAAASAT